MSSSDKTAKGKIDNAFDSRFLLPGYWLVWFGFALLWLLKWLPHRWRQSLGRMLGRSVFSRNSKRTEIINTNLEWTHPHWSAAQRATATHGLSGYLGQMIVEFGTLWWGSDRSFDELYQIEGREHLDQLIAAKRNIVLITGHSVFIDLCGMAVSRHYPMVGYVNKSRNPLMQWMMSHGRSRYGLKVLQRESGLRELMRNITSGRLPYYVVDEDFGPQQSIFVPFYDVAKATLTTPARIAKMTDAAVVPVSAYFDKKSGKYQVVILPPLQNFPSGNTGQDATAVNRALEALIDLAPEQYMWTLRLFQSRPDGSPPPYTMNGKPGSGPRPRPTDLSH